MKATIKEIKVHTPKPEWSIIKFKAYRNEANEVILPQDKWIASEDVEELNLVAGDVVVL